MYALRMVRTVGRGQPMGRGMRGVNPALALAQAQPRLSMHKIAMGVCKLPVVTLIERAVV